MAQFDSKSFSEKAFKYSVERVPNMKMNELKKSRVLAGNTDIDNVFTTQNGTVSFVFPAGEQSKCGEVYLELL